MARGRKPGFQMGAEHRSKIANSKILSHLIAHAEGRRKMTSTQVTAGLGLLDRVMPKLATHTLQGDEEAPPIKHEVSGAAKLTEFLDQIAERSGTDS